jgi:hypothetical protein
MDLASTVIFTLDTADLSVSIHARSTEGGRPCEHDVDGILRGDAEERGGLVAEVRPTTGQVGERADDDERGAELVRHERDGGAPELGVDELAVGGVVDEHVGAASPGDAHHPRSAG